VENDTVIALAMKLLVVYRSYWTIDNLET